MTYHSPGPRPACGRYMAAGVDAALRRYLLRVAEARQQPARA